MQLTVEQNYNVSLCIADTQRVLAVAIVQIHSKTSKGSMNSELWSLTREKQDLSWGSRLTATSCLSLSLSLSHLSLKRTSGL